MTNLSDSSQKKKNKLVIIHGFNNNEDSFVPLRERLHALGWETHFLTLPCHGKNRNEADTFEEALASFDRSLKPLSENDYGVIAFSQGGLYFQLWLDKFREHKRPKGQVLLAPALYIHRHRLIESITSVLPSFFHIKSFSPKFMRRYESLRIVEYRLLTGGIRAYQQTNPDFLIPTLLLIDPKDELVDAGKIKEKFAGKKVSFEFVMRDYLKKGPGCHHILFHPDYFSAEDWNQFTGKIDRFLKESFLI